MTWVRSWRTAAGLFVASTAIGACVERVEVGALSAAVGGGAGSGGNGGSGGIAFAGAETGGTPSPGGAGSGGTAGAAVCEPADCLGRNYACGDCEDNDGDGLLDARDPECLGVCDNTEDAYFGGIPGQNNAPCRQDCYFDADTGSGNDECVWSHSCDPQAVAPSYPPSGNARCEYSPDAAIPGIGAACAELASTQSENCAAYCGPLTPNGCDCFGCCELPAGSGRTVWIGSELGGQGSCTPATLEDPEACRPCTPVLGCWNSCEPCEDCVGRVGPSPGCADGTSQCAGGLAPCGRPDQAACAAGSYCVTGCCAAVPR